MPECGFRKGLPDSHLCHQTGQPIGMPCTGECQGGSLPVESESESVLVAIYIDARTGKEFRRVEDPAYVPRIGERVKDASFAFRVDDIESHPDGGTVRIFTNYLGFRG